MFGQAHKHYVLAVLTSVYMVSLVDRGLMMLLLQPIKEDLQLSDTQVGFLTGIAFGLFYATIGVPLGRWADRGDRVTISAIAISLWSVTVMACLWVSNYTQLVLARIAAAVGESGCKPPTYSLVGDYFPKAAERTRAMSVYVTGNFLSTLATFMLGGWLNERYGWRTTFFLLSLPGFLLAVLVKLTLIDPRSRAQGAKIRELPKPRFATVLAALWRQRTCRHLSIALILLYTLGLGLGPWYAAFLMRSHRMGSAEVGIWLGPIFGLAGMAGALGGGYVAARWFADNERAQMRLAAIAVASILPFFLAFLMVPEKHQALFALIPVMVVFGIFLAPTYALLQRAVGDDMRATMMAVVMLLANVIGFGVGPEGVGVLSDILRPLLGRESLRYAMLSMSFLSIWAAYHFWRVGQTVMADLPKATVNGRPLASSSNASRRQVLG